MLRLFRLIPLMVLPLGYFNIIHLVQQGGNFWGGEIFRMQMISGGLWIMTHGDMILVLALGLLIIELAKAATPRSVSIGEHVLSLVVALAFLVEFLLVGWASNSLFFLLMLISFIDVVCGFIVSLKAAKRDIDLDRSVF